MTTLTRILNIIRYTNAVAIEATWLDREIAPAVGVEGEEGYQEEKTVDTVVKSTAYAGNQIDLLRNDAVEYGGDTSEYEALIAGVEADFVPDPELPAPIPAVVTRAQARKALAIKGLLALVQPAIDAIQDALQQQLVQIDWDDSQTFERDNATLGLLAIALGLTSVQLDELFTLAATL